MTKLPMISAVAAAMAFAPTALAANGTAIDGAYLLRQNDGHMRMIALEPSGTVSQVSDQQSTLGFTPGLGTWVKTGSGTAKATVVDFNQPSDASDTEGAALIVYDLNFTDPVDGKYQAVTGQFSGQVFHAGQDPVLSQEPHVRNFGNRFEGARIVAR